MKSCEWREKIGLYVDGELEPAADQAFTGHLQSCAECSAAVLEQQELKKAVRVAAKRFSAPPELYASVRRQISPEEKRRTVAQVERNCGIHGFAGSGVIRVAVAFIRVWRDR